MKIKKFELIFVYAFISVILLVYIFPVIWFSLTSLKSRLEYLAYPPVWWPSKLQWKNYTLTLLGSKTTEYLKESIYLHGPAESGLILFIMNSAIVAFSSMLISIFVGGLCAYSIARFKTGGNSFSFWILSTRMAPPISIIIPLYMIMKTLGLLDTRISLIAVHTLINLPFVVWVMKGFFQEVPLEIEEAALIDGCSRFNVIVRIAVPLAIPGLVTTAIFCLVQSWNEFLFALILTYSPKSQTLPVILAAFKSTDVILWGPLAAAALATALPVWLFALFIQKYLVRGLTLGAIK